MSEWWEDPEWERWESRVREEVIPMLLESAFTISIAPSGESDVKFAVELGLSIMMDKPIIAVIRPGQEIPEKFRRIADLIVEADLSDPREAAALAEKMQEIMHRLVGESEES